MPPWSVSAETEAQRRQVYSLTCIEEFDQVLVQLPHAPGREAKMSKAEFAKWFRKA